MPIADAEKRRAYDRERYRTSSKAKLVIIPTSCAICGGTLPPHNGRGRKRKICDNPSCRRKYKTQKQREYGVKPRTPEQIERDRARSRENGKRRTGSRNSWEWNLKHVHGMTPDQWHAIFMEQRGLCYLGGHPLPDDRKRIAVDHDHSHCGPTRSCGVCRRGLACSNCNTAIGYACDDPELLRRMADNLERAKELTAALLMTAPVQGDLFADGTR